MLLLTERLDDQAREAINGATEVLDRLIAALALYRGPDKGPIFYHRARVKNVTSIQNKVRNRRRRPRNRGYAVADIKDIVGLRLITLYDEEIPSAFQVAVDILTQSLDSRTSLHRGMRLESKITDYIAQHQTQHSEIPSRPIKIRDLWNSAISEVFRLPPPESSFWDNLTEITYFPRSPNDDDIYKTGYESLTAQRPDIADKLYLTPYAETEYSSMHIQYRVPIESESRPRFIPVEIQIRTEIEDLWAEVSHSNEYKIEHQQIWNEQLEDKYKLLKSDLAILKGNLISSDQILNRLRSTYYVTQHIINEVVTPRTVSIFSIVMLRVEDLLKGHIDADGYSLLNQYEKLFGQLALARSRLRQTRILNESLSILTKVRYYVQTLHRLHWESRTLINLFLDFELIRLQTVKADLPLPEFYRPRRRSRVNRIQTVSILRDQYFSLLALEAQDWKVRSNNTLKLLEVLHIVCLVQRSAERVCYSLSVCGV